MVNTRFYDLPDSVRFAVYHALDEIDCQTHNSGGSGNLCVAVAKGKFGALIEKMKQYGLKNKDLYYFPLGTDKPDTRFRHASHGIENSAWLIAVFSL